MAHSATANIQEVRSPFLCVRCSAGAKGALSSDLYPPCSHVVPAPVGCDTWADSAFALDVSTSSERSPTTPTCSAFLVMLIKATEGRGQDSNSLSFSCFSEA